mgnify:CR=1 FL=1
MNPRRLPSTPPARQGRGGPRCTQALMPDYNRKAATYWWVMALTRASVRSALALHQMRRCRCAAQVTRGDRLRGGDCWPGLYPVRIPGSKNSFAAGEIFIFLLLLMHGPAAAVLAAAGEALVGSMRSSSAGPAAW